MTGGAAAVLTLVLLRRRPGRLRLDRGRAALRLAARGGARYAASAPRLFAAAGEQRQLLREDLALQTAEDVAGTLGAMKGVMMKIGQMASYVDGGLSPAVRGTLARLQDSVPPMSPQLAAAVVEEELGAPPDRAFARWDPHPIAAASIGQVHRAVTLDGRAVAVKVQYPGIAETIAADLRNVALIRRMLRIAASAQDRRRADQRAAGPDRRGAGLPPRGRQPAPDGRLLPRPPHHRRPRGSSTGCPPRLITSELSGGARFAELATGPSTNATWPPRRSTGSSSAACTRCAPSTATRTRATTCSTAAARSPSWTSGWSGTSPPPNCSRSWRWPAPSASSTTPRRSAPAWRTPDSCARRAAGAQAITEHLAVFYDTIREPGPLTITSDYASSVVRRFFDLRSPVAGTSPSRSPT